MTTQINSTVKDKLLHDVKISQPAGLGTAIFGMG